MSSIQQIRDCWPSCNQDSTPNFPWKNFWFPNVRSHYKDGCLTRQATDLKIEIAGPTSQVRERPKCVRSTCHHVCRIAQTRATRSAPWDVADLVALDYLESCWAANVTLVTPQLRAQIIFREDLVGQWGPGA